MEVRNKQTKGRRQDQNEGSSHWKLVVIENTQTGKSLEDEEHIGGKAHGRAGNRFLHMEERRRLPEILRGKAGLLHLW